MLIEKDERREHECGENKRHALGLYSEQKKERHWLQQEGMQNARRKEKEKGYTLFGIGGEQYSNCQQRPILSKVEGFHLILANMTSREVHSIKLTMVKCHSRMKSVKK